MMKTQPHFSYTDHNDPLIKKGLIRLLEWFSGKKVLANRYAKAQLFIKQNCWNFWKASLQALEIDLNYNDFALESFTQKKALVVIANHPFGILDGIIICYLIEQIRPDFKILTNSMLCQADEINPYLLPIDFAETKEALQKNLQSRKAALEHLKNNGTIILFPAGGVSTTHGYTGKARDFEWKTFTATLIHQANADVLPVFFHGQNSRLFQWVSQFSQTLRLSLLINEACNKIGKEIKINIGEVVPYHSIAHLKNRKILTEHLRAITYSLEKPKEIA
ncbi:lysophospholipid acyltransferase family protein [Chondrinema litorale]|uniref:lysophospholipid acyltransferase family protein n=1 Tax=Chondrinema litorale TaxID=2994555 RepID=UPI002543CF89|nr:lysophospholipid acyltransferase family protein [Chondrinema litorale]UZR98635.1 lysophospholipid acyltransferase family protein [Chondrinema litorale]